MTICTTTFCFRKLYGCCYSLQLAKQTLMQPTLIYKSFALTLRCIMVYKHACKIACTYIEYFQANVIVQQMCTCCYILLKLLVILVRCGYTQPFLLKIWMDGWEICFMAPETHKNRYIRNICDVGLLYTISMTTYEGYRYLP